MHSRARNEGCSWRVLALTPFLLLLFLLILLWLFLGITSLVHLTHAIIVLVSAVQTSRMELVGLAFGAPLLIAVFRVVWPFPHWIRWLFVACVCSVETYLLFRWLGSGCVWFPLSVFVTWLLLVNESWIPTSEVDMERAEEELLKAHGIDATHCMVAGLSTLEVNTHDPTSMTSSSSSKNNEILQATSKKATVDTAPTRAATTNNTATTTSEIDASSSSNGAGTNRSSSNSSSSSSAGATLSKKPVLVMCHGYASGKAVLASTFVLLLPHFQVYALDWRGFGRSDRRHTFRASDPQETIDYFLSSLERWREEMGIARMALFGHSMGGYLAGLYALRYPSRVNHLFLVSPVGLPAHTSPRPLPRLAHFLWDSGVTPIVILRLFGPVGPALSRLLARLRWGDVLTERQAVATANYLWHINAGVRCADVSIVRLLKAGAWPRKPLAPMLSQLQLPVTFVYGDHDWMGYGHCLPVIDQVNRKFQGEHKQREAARVYIVEQSDHQVFMTQGLALARVVIHDFFLLSNAEPDKESVSSSTSAERENYGLGHEGGGKVGKDGGKEPSRVVRMEGKVVIHGFVKEGVVEEVESGRRLLDENDNTTVATSWYRSTEKLEGSRGHVAPKRIDRSGLQCEPQHQHPSLFRVRGENGNLLRQPPHPLPPDFEHR
eukprot:gb/GEZN01003248.1/.p1 GENE.gb/GEZN01003248.1/~~gb/GEZN01003248.1/.p1  ORF type:complete len:662 (+),score=79.26 gb/GEZN01003248.1/:91-2076(+)